MIAVTVQPNLPPAHVPYGDLRLGVLVARAAYPTNPCNGHEQVSTSSTPPAWARETSRVAAARHWTLLGAADLAGERCLIWVRTHEDRALTCKLVMHEEGHWNGLIDFEPGAPAMKSGISTVSDAGGPESSPDFPVPACEVPGS